MRLRYDFDESFEFDFFPSVKTVEIFFSFLVRNAFYHL